MALAASRVDVVQDGENAVAVKTDVLLDPESGLLLERKTVVAEVLTESGNHKAILVGQQTSVKSVVKNCFAYLRLSLNFFLRCSSAQGLSTEVSAAPFFRIRHANIILYTSGKYTYSTGPFLSIHCSVHSLDSHATTTCWFRQWCTYRATALSVYTALMTQCDNPDSTLLRN